MSLHWEGGQLRGEDAERNSPSSSSIFRRNWENNTVTSGDDHNEKTRCAQPALTAL